jgi:hypothetical protein
MTNYEKIMSEMTVEKLAEMINDGINACTYCALREKELCGGHCHTGIELWLKQEVKDEAN